MKTERESDVIRHFKRIVKCLGGEMRKVEWIGRRGAPDHRVMIPGVRIDLRPAAFWVEFKAPGEKLKPHQAREHTRMRAAGEQVFVVDGGRSAGLAFNTGLNSYLLWQRFLPVRLQNWVDL
jgi:hypothetical protein